MRCQNILVSCLGVERDILALAVLATAAASVVAAGTPPRAVVLAQNVRDSTIVPRLVYMERECFHRLYIGSPTLFQ